MTPSSMASSSTGGHVVHRYMASSKGATKSTTSRTQPQLTWSSQHTLLQVKHTYFGLPRSPWAQHISHVGNASTSGRYRRVADVDA